MGIFASSEGRKIAGMPQLIPRRIFGLQKLGRMAIELGKTFGESGTARKRLGTVAPAMGKMPPRTGKGLPGLGMEAGKSGDAAAALGKLIQHLNLAP